MTLKLNAEVDKASPPGTIINRAMATGVCADAPMHGDAETETTVGTGLGPAVPAPVGNLGGNEQASPRSSSAAGPGESETLISSTRVTRSASATSGEVQSATGPAASGQADAARTAGLIPRSGADGIPTLALGLTLLGAGRALRRVKPRR
jgi:hypothetical protein